MSWEARVESALKKFVEQVRTDVDRHLLARDSSEPADFVWTFSVPSDGGVIVIGIDGNGRVVKQIFDATVPIDADMARLTARVAFMVIQRVLPIILRLAPGLPFIAGDAPNSQEEKK